MFRPSPKNTFRALLSSLFLLGLLGMTTLAHGFDAQGHRGARGLMPENTLASFAHALSIGVNTIELDVGVSKDNVILVTHNPRLDSATTRDNEGNWLTDTGPAIRSLTLNQIKSYDVGRLNPNTRYAKRYPEQVAVDGQRIPTLEEVLIMIKRSGNTHVRLNIETKLQPTEPELFLPPESFVSVLFNVIREQGFMERITIQSFDWRTLQETQRQFPGVRTSYLSVNQSWHNNIQSGVPGPSPWTAGFDIDTFDGGVPEMIKTAGGNTWSPYFREVSAAKIQQAHDLGLQVKVWTVNEEDTMEAMISMGVDGIITDYPDRLNKVLDKLGMAIPTATPASH